MKKWISLLTAVAVLTACVASMPMTSLAVGKGDVNNDGKISTADVRMMLKMVAEEKTPTEQQMYWGDYNVNGTLDTTDARTLLEMTLVADSDRAPNYAAPQKLDHWGDRSITLLGDSISFGVGSTGSITEYSYVGLVKKAYAAANNGNMNYGFTSAYATSWQPGNRSDELHNWPERTETNGETDWVCDGDEDGNRLCSVAMTAKKPWAVLTYELRPEYKDDYNYFCIYYQAKKDAGNFVVADGASGEVADIHGNKNYIVASDNTTATTNETRRTAFYRLSDCPDGKIRICSGALTSENTPISITGIGYYKDISTETVTFNSYTRGGIALSNMSDKVLDIVSSSETLIVALGFNDVHYNYEKVQNGTFKERVDYLIEQCKKNGTNVIVNDYVWFNTSLYQDTWGWDDARLETFRGWHTYTKDQLKRLARETGGIYIDQQKEIGSDKILADLNSSKADQIHPSNAGHAMIAENVIEALGLK